MLLGRLGLDFRSVAPDIDERSLGQETPDAMALRLAEAKACKVAETETTALIIGSDQVAVMGDHILGKPGSHQAAAAQLEAMSGKAVVFHTALCLFNARSGRAQLANVPTTVHFRRLDTAQIDRYLQQDRPYDCAGSAKIEALGISLVESVDSTDPTALIGLPLIALVDMLQREGVTVP
jgi:septum formation protein